MTKKQILGDAYYILENAGNKCDDIYNIEINAFTEEGAVRKAVDLIQNTPLTGEKYTQKEIDDFLAKLRTTCGQITNAGFLCNKSNRISKCKKFVDKHEEFIRSLVGTPNNFANTVNPDPYAQPAQPEPPPIYGPQMEQDNIGDIISSSLGITDRDSVVPYVAISLGVLIILILLIYAFVD
jgi:hypothetical protein